MKDYLKAIYSPAKSVAQLLGELGNEFQDNNETVITFANRISMLGDRIFEAKKLEGGTISETFKNSIQSNMVDYFKAGLKPEIEHRLDPSTNVNDIVKNAVKIEKLLLSRQSLRTSRSSKTIDQERRKPKVCQSIDKIENKNKIFTCSKCATS